MRTPVALGSSMAAACVVSITVRSGGGGDFECFCSSEGWREGGRWEMRTEEGFACSGYAGQLLFYAN